MIIDPTRAYPTYEPTVMSSSIGLVNDEGNAIIYLCKTFVLGDQVKAKQMKPVTSHGISVHIQWLKPAGIPCSRLGHIISHMWNSLEKKYQRGVYDGDTILPTGFVHWLWF